MPWFLDSISETPVSEFNLPALFSLSSNVGWYLPHTQTCFLSERHSFVSLDDDGRPHCENGPAVVYPDGLGIYAWHGVLVNEKIICRPHELTVEEIDLTANLEVRRAMINRFGEARYLLAGEVECVDDDPAFGTLFVKAVAGDEPMTMVRVLNATAEIDGSARVYFLRVPPGTHTAREGVAGHFECAKLNILPRRKHEQFCGLRGISSEESAQRNQLTKLKPGNSETSNAI